MQQRSSTRIAAFAGLAVSISGASAQVSRQVLPSDVLTGPVSPERLYLNAGTVDTAGGRDGLETQAGAPGRFVIQLDGPITPTRRAAIEAAGVVLGDYLPMHAYIVTLDGAARAGLAGLDFVQWWEAFDDSWKVDPELGLRTYETEPMLEILRGGKLPTVVTLFRGEDVLDAEAIVGGIGNVRGIDYIGDQAILSVDLDPGRIGDLAAVDGVQYIEPAPEVTLRNDTVRWIVQSNATNSFPIHDQGIRGEGQIVGVLDSRVDRNHCSFVDSNPIGPSHRKIVAYNTSFGAWSHGTHVAGTAVGEAGTDSDTRGVAYMGKLAFNTTPSYNDSAIYSRLSLHNGQGAHVHTNSWGNDGTTAYDSLCRGFDRFQYDFEDDLVMLAVTNTSTLRNPENAKNLLAVGASRDTPSQASHCTGGTGPTADGRRKPEIYAPGCGTRSADAGTSCSVQGATGTSMASPAVAGTGLLVRQYFMDGFYPSGSANGSDAFTPSGALVKATLLNSAVDMTGVSGYPSNREGWGRVLADNSLFFDGDARVLQVAEARHADGLSTGQSVDIPVSVSGSSEDFRVTLVWTDPPASAGAGFAAINDLNLLVMSPSGQEYRGNVFSGGFSTTGGSYDDRNNVEQVHLASPETGEWTVRVQGAGVNVGTQGYAVAITGELGQSCPADFNNDQQVDTQDVLDFLNAYTAMDDSADINDDGIFNSQDILAFLNIFTDGC